MADTGPMAAAGPARIVKPVGKQNQTGWIVDGEGDNAVKLVQRKIDWPRQGEVLVRIRAFGLSRSDVFQRSGHFNAAPGSSNVLGLEIAGEVAAVGSDVENWDEGDHLCCLLPGGGCAEFVICPASQCLPLPKGFSWQMAAAIPVSLATSWSCLFDEGQLESGKTVLIHGSAGGIGHVMVQMAKAFGIRVISTCSSQERADWCKSIGADLSIVREGSKFVDQVMHFTLGKGVDVVVDLVGKDMTYLNLQALAVRGRLVQISAAQPSVTLNLQLLLDKQLSIVGCSIRHREPAYYRYLAQVQLEKLWPLLDSGAIRPRIHSVLPMTEVANALDLIEKSKVMGKIVCTVERK